MSTVVVWGTNEGTGKIGSCYVASDSRFSNGKSWDYGQKVYSLNENGIVAYVGDVLYPLTIIPQIIELINNEIIFKKDETNDNKIQKVFEYLKRSSQDFLNTLKTTTIIFVFVHNKKFDSYKVTFNPIKYNNLEMKAGKAFAFGSGASTYRKKLNKVPNKEKVNPYINSTVNERAYSRYIFQSLDSAIKEGGDQATGGNIQLAGLFKNGTSQLFGIVQNNKRYFLGLEVTEYSELSHIKWRNENFEDVDPKNMVVNSKAQKQPYHKSLE